jgi:hypothetical protein
MRLYKKKDEINVKEWIEHEIFMFFFSVNFGEKTNKIKEIYICIDLNDEMNCVIMWEFEE